MSLSNVSIKVNDIPEDTSDTKMDNSLIAKNLMKAVLKQKQNSGDNSEGGSSSSSAPLTTKAIRDLEKAQKERVYSCTVIRIK